MKLIYLEYFLQVVKYGSISKAADALLLKKSNLSTYIKILEEEFHADLFLRTSKGVQLTAEGQQVYLWAEHLLDEQKHLKKLFQTHQNDTALKGIIDIYLTASINADSYNDFLFSFSCKHPYVQLNFYEESLKKSIDSISTNENALGIILCDENLLTYAESKPELIVLPMRKYAFIVYAAKNSLYAKTFKSISLNNLSKIPLLIYRPSLSETSPVVEILQQYTNLNIEKTTPNLHLLQMFLNTGLYATVGVSHVKGMDDYVAITLRNSIKLTSCLIVNRKAMSKPAANIFVNAYFDSENMHSTGDINNI